MAEEQTANKGKGTKESIVVKRGRGFLKRNKRLRNPEKLAGDDMGTQAK